MPNSLLQILAEGLKEAGKKNLALSSVEPKIPDDRQRDMSMENLAEPIARAIEEGECSLVKSTVDFLNSVEIKSDTVLYLIEDTGVLLGTTPLAVYPGDIVRWNGLSWISVGSGQSIDAYTKQETDECIANSIGFHDASPDSHSDIRQAISNEASSRSSADGQLQAQIDAIVSKSDVVDIVGTYADLLALDTSAMFDNDIVKVLSDESRQGKKTYYYWDLTNETWTYVGSEAETYTKSEVDSMLSAKVDKVNGKGLSTNDFTDAAKSITDNIFLATYNSTSYDDIKAAYDAGKTILCHFTDSRHTVRVATFDRLTHSTTSTSYAYFASVTKTDAYELVASKTRYGTTTTWSNTHKTWGALAEKDNVTNADISGTIQDAHIASASTWNGKQDAINDLSTIISNASNGQTSYGWGDHRTWTPTFSQASSRTNLNGSGETIATIFGKIQKWFADLGSNSLAWISKNTSGSDSKVLSQKGNWVSLPSIPSVPTALSDLTDDSTHRLVTDTEKSTWNNKQNALATQTAYSNKGSGTKVARITTNSLGQVTNIEEVSIQFPSSSGMSTDASNASDVAIRNLINKITSVSDDIGSDEYFVTVSRIGQWKYTMNTLKSWCREGLANDSEVMHKSVEETITAEKTLSRGSGQNTYWRCKRSDTGEDFRFGIGSGGDNRGIWDTKTINGWVLRLDDTGNVCLGDTTDSSGTVFLKLPTYASNYVINSGIWANQNPGSDVGDIQFGCYCYNGDTKRYGVQLDADRSSDKYGIWCYPSSSVSKWLCYMKSDGVAHLGKNTDAQVQLGNRVFDFSGTFGASSNTIYFI